MIKTIKVILFLLSVGLFYGDRGLAGSAQPASTPAERARGCVWADRFESQALVERNGGSVTGAPTFSARDGVTLDGANDYLTYNLTGREFNSDPLSIAIEFTPDFSDQDGVSHVMLDTSNVNGGRCIVYKDASNRIAIYLGNTSIATIANATFHDYWSAGKNIVVISGTTGDTSAWLNGTKILDADISAWTPASETTLYVGAMNDGSAKFDGTIHRVQVYNQKLSDLECEQISSGTVYSYPQGTVWDFTVAHGLSDVSGSNTLIAYNAPTKLAAHGYEFDGVNQYLNGNLDTDPFNFPEITIVMEYSPDWVPLAALAGQEYYYYYGNKASGGLFRHRIKYEPGTIRFYRVDSTILMSASYSELAALQRQNQRNVLVASYSSTSGCVVWLNGSDLCSTADTWVVTSDQQRMDLMGAGGSDPMPGRLYSFRVIPAQLSRMQAIDITQRLLKQANRK